jgi:hypothetical protein
MAYKINDNTERIIATESNRASLAIRFMLDAAHTESRPKTPMKTGALRGDVNKTVKGNVGQIKWGRKYAWYQERGYTSGPVKRYTTPGTSAHFAETSVRNVAKDGRKYFKMAGI